MIAAVAARAGALAGIDPDLIPFTAVLGLVRAGLHADTRCGHCGRLPADPLGQLIERRHRPPPPSPWANAHVRQDSSRTTLQAHRRSDLHHHHHAVKSPTIAANTLKLRAVAHVPVSPDRQDETWVADGYGYGWFVGTVTGRRVYFHPGDNPGYLAFNAWLPDDDTRLAVLVNEERPNGWHS